MLIIVRQKYKFSLYLPPFLKIKAKKISANVILAKFLQIIRENGAKFYIF